MFRHVLWFGALLPACAFAQMSDNRIEQMRQDIYSGLVQQGAQYYNHNQQDATHANNPQDATGANYQVVAVRKRINHLIATGRCHKAQALAELASEAALEEKARQACTANPPSPSTATPSGPSANVQ